MKYFRVWNTSTRLDYFNFTLTLGDNGFKMRPIMNLLHFNARLVVLISSLIVMGVGAAHILPTDAKIEISSNKDTSSGGTPVEVINPAQTKKGNIEISSNEETMNSSPTPVPTSAQTNESAATPTVNPCQP